MTVRHFHLGPLDHRWLAAHRELRDALVGALAAVAVAALVLVVFLVRA
ncbi:hypothetical protein [Geodermatophilus sp. SYSU D00815]